MELGCYLETGASKSSVKLFKIKLYLVQGKEENFSQETHKLLYL